MALKIDVYSDVICPWCYLGKRRLEKALETAGLKDKAEIHFKPFELNPDTPLEGLGHKEHLARKFGSASRLDAAHQRLTELGKQEGLDYHFEKIEKTPNTLKAHRLLWLGEQEGVQSRLKEALMEGYFSKGMDLGDSKVLEDLAVAVGMDRSKVQKFLKSDEGEEEVRQAENKAYSLGVTGVPFFVFNEEAGLSGAHDVQTFLSVLSEFKEKS